MLSPVQSSPVQSSPVSAAASSRTVDAAGITRLHTDTRNIGSTIDANLGGVNALPPSPPGPRNLAMAAMDFGEKWANNVSRLADFLDVNLGNSLNFAHADVRHLSHDLNHNAPDARTARDTQHLLGDWSTKSQQAFDTIRHGLFRNAEQDIGQAAHALSRAGVTSPAIQSAMGEVANVLRMVDAFMSRPGGPPGGPIGGIGGGRGGPVLDGPLPGRPTGGGSPGLDLPMLNAMGGGIGQPGPGPLGPFDTMFNQAMAKLNQALGADAQAHPEHVQALRDADAAVGNAVRQLNQGMTAVAMTQIGMMQDLRQLGWTPQPQPLPPANAAANGDARDGLQAA